MFYLALVPNIVDLAEVTLSAWAVLSVLTVAVLFLVLLPYPFAATRLRSVFSDARALRRLNRGAALLIGGVGTLLFADATRGR